MMKYILFLLLLIGFSCSSHKVVLEAKNHFYPSPVDTKTRTISYQHKKTYHVGQVSASNEFPSARLNDFIQLNDSTYQASISPENSPINESPWYGFKIWSVEKQTIKIKLHYTEHEHRYNPKISKDGETWEILDSNLIQLTPDSIHAYISLDISKDTLWVASQEIHDHNRVGQWVNKIGRYETVTVGKAGESVQGRSLYYLNISNKKYKKKPTIIIISRQHPPEVTGYFAMQAFVETIIKKGGKNGFLDKFRVMVYPLLNPDGVDLGHFRHNTGGVDLNRDWSQYHQPEIKQIANHMVKESSVNRNNVVLGLDFHSTYYDVYYTNDSTVVTKLPGFTDAWLQRIEKELKLDDINDQPSGLGPPTSKGWFNQQFGAESITYEIGDDTPREFIKVKGEVSAVAMMEILLANAKVWRLY